MLAGSVAESAGELTQPTMTFAGDDEGVARGDTV